MSEGAATRISMPTSDRLCSWSHTASADRPRAASVNACGTWFSTWDDSWVCVGHYPIGHWASHDYDSADWTTPVAFGMDGSTGQRFIGGDRSWTESFCRKTVHVGWG
jgi:hypothetical protein